MLPRSLTFATMLAVAALGCSGGDESGAGGTEAPSAAATEPNPSKTPVTTASPPIAGENLGDVSGVIERVKDSVVVVNNLAVGVDDAGEATVNLNSTGSGVVVDDIGSVVTNRHVVDGADRVSVQTRDGRVRSAEVLAILGDTSDLALLRVASSDGLEPVILGDSLELEVGDGTVVVGNPVGIGLSAATGIVSARGRVIATSDAVLYDVLQTDAAVNPGNSGGALLNERGELIGVNTAVRGETEGIGFAIPVDQVRAFLGAVADERPVPFIGAGFDTLDADLLATTPVESGVGVLGLLPGGSAEEGGLSSSDIVVEVDRTPVGAATEVAAAIDGKEPGESISLRVLRQGLDGDEFVDLDIEVAGAIPLLASELAD